MVGSGALVVGGGSVCCDLGRGMLALLMYSREIMLTPSPELANCAPAPYH